MFTCNSTKLTYVPIIAYNSNVHFAWNDPFSHLRSHMVVCMFTCAYTHARLCLRAFLCLCLATTSGRRAGNGKSISTTCSERAKQGLGAKGKKMCVRVCVCIHACTFACVCACMRVYMCVCTCSWLLICVCLCVWVLAYVHVCVIVCLHPSVCCVCACPFVHLWLLHVSLHGQKVQIKGEV